MHRTSASRPAAPAHPVLPFFVGAGRSGTTLVRSMFNAHPDMAVPHEAHFVAAMARRVHRYQDQQGLRTDAFVRDLFNDRKFARLGIDEASVRTALASPAVTGYADAARAMLALYAGQRGKTRYADKTPGYVLRIPLLARLFPEARFVHIIRDGRDVAMAFADVSFGPRHMAEAAIYWRRRIERGRRAGRVLGPERYTEVRYEDLVDDPEPVVRRLCEFADLGFDDRMLRYFEDAEATVSDTGRAGAHQRLALPPTKGLRDWRHEMSSSDVALFESIAGQTLDVLGYEPACAQLPARTHLRAAGHRIAWQGWRLRYNVATRLGRPIGRQP